jgi:signal transduction histidine kinase
MLDITRIDNGKLALQTETFDLVKLVEDIIERYLIQFSKIEIVTDGPIIGNWDRVRIDQVISNLIANSIKYGEQSPITVHLSKINNNAVISIKDSGPGIAKENQLRIFQRFERETGDTSVSGLGLGLYICKEIVERHNGDISVESAPGMGATFNVVLPLT